MNAMTRDNITTLSALKASLVAPIHAMAGAPMRRPRPERDGRGRFIKRS